MSPMSAPSSRPTVNVYTGLAFISMVAMLATMVYMLVKLMPMGIFG